jgi:hypothetical protein
MSGVRVLVGTRKGAFILTSDGKRERWDVSDPHFGGWEIYHLKGSPVSPDRLYASQSTGWHGPRKRSQYLFGSLERWSGLSALGLSDWVLATSEGELGTLKWAHLPRRRANQLGGVALRLAVRLSKSVGTAAIRPRKVGPGESYRWGTAHCGRRASAARTPHGKR